MKKIKITLIIFVLFLITSCYPSYITTLPTPAGKKAQITAQKNINKQRRQINRYHKRNKRKIDRLQNQSVEPYKSYNKNK